MSWEKQNKSHQVEHVSEVMARPLSLKEPWVKGKMETYVKQHWPKVRREVVSQRVLDPTEDSEDLCFTCHGEMVQSVRPKHGSTFDSQSLVEHSVTFCFQQ